MKTKFTLVLLLLLGISTFAQNTLIPDPAFEQVLIDLNLDSGPINGFVPTANISSRTLLFISNSGITDLTGIEDFTALTWLECRGNQLTSIDVSQNLNLNSFDCTNNSITHLDISSNVNITQLGCAGNLLESLNIQNGNTSNINTFFADNNPNLDCIQVDNPSWSAANMTNIDSQTSYSTNCHYGETYVPDANFEAYLETHNSTANTVAIGSPLSMGNGIANDHYVTTAHINTVYFLSIYNQNIADLTGVQDFAALGNLSVSGNQLTSLDLSQNLNLTQLYCSTNSLTSLDLTANTSLLWVECFNNSLTSLNMGSKPSLITLRCFNNSITSLNLSQLSALNELNCNDNALTSLNTASNSGLKNLRCANNSITSIDVSNNLALEALDASRNALTNMVFGNNTALIYVYVGWNSLTDLDLSTCTGLIDLLCHSNLLTSLNLKNGNNTNMFIFSGTLNPSLECVNVDNVAYSNTNWVNIDAQAYFSANCYDTYVPDINFEQALIDYGYDTVLDGYVLTSNINTITTLDVSNKSINDMTGIEAFSALTNLNCASNTFSALDLSSNVLLITVECHNNSNLTSLNVSQNVALKGLNASQSPITSVDVTTMPSLMYLNVESIGLTSLDVSQNSLLVQLYCGLNTIGELDVSNNTSLEKLLVQNNQLVVFNAAPLNQLVELDVSSNLLTKLNVKNGTNTSMANATSFDARNNPNLTCIMVDTPVWSTTNWTQIDSSSRFNDNCGTYVPDTNFEQALIDLGYDTVLDNYVLTSNINTVTILDISNKSISDMTGIEAFSALTSLNCTSNTFSVLDLSSNVMLLNLECGSNNNLVTLDLSQNVALTSLNTSQSTVANINVNAMSNLTYLNVESTGVTGLDLSQNSLLQELYCGHNTISVLDINNNTALEVLGANNNELIVP